MDLIFCTLFNSGYLDKGLVLYDSMVRSMDNFKLYVFAFDEKCRDILIDMNLKNMIVVSLEEFETPELLIVKEERTAAEYCWTCSSWSIKHVLEHYNEPICTYIDADMRFFSSPQIVFDDMHKRNCSVIITPHRYRTEEEERKAECLRGKYCVEFNTFVNDKNGLEALNWWADRCLEWCFYAVPGTTEWYGDQKYLNVFPDKFEGVYICEHLGVGLAPWNNCLVEYSPDQTDDKITICEKKTGIEYNLIIYHFENVSFLSRNILHTSSQMKDRSLHKEVYDTYVREILQRRKFLKEQYAYVMARKRRILTKNLALRIYQKYIGPMRRIKHIYDLYWVKGE